MTGTFTAGWIRNMWQQTSFVEKSFIAIDAETLIIFPTNEIDHFHLKGRQKNN